jgi:hypothetical protein
MASTRAEVDVGVRVNFSFAVAVAGRAVGRLSAESVGEAAGVAVVKGTAVGGNGVTVTGAANVVKPAAAVPGWQALKSKAEAARSKAGSHQRLAGALTPRIPASRLLD